MKRSPELSAASGVAASCLVNNGLRGVLPEPGADTRSLGPGFLFSVATLLP